MAAFDRYIGVDYSGAETPSSSLKGLRVYMADHSTPPQEVLPPPSPRKYWTRRGIADWLVAMLMNERPTLVGIDHGFSFPLKYFRGTVFRLPGLPFLTTFIDIGRRMATTFTLILSARALSVTAQHGPGTRAGVA